MFIKSIKMQRSIRSRGMRGGKIDDIINFLENIKINENLLDKGLSLPFGLNIELSFDQRKVAYKKGSDFIEVTESGHFFFYINMKIVCKFTINTKTGKIIKYIDTDTSNSVFNNETGCQNYTNDFLVKVNNLTYFLLKEDIKINKSQIDNASAKYMNEMNAAEQDEHRRGGKSVKKSSPVSTGRTYKCKDGVTRKLYRRGDEMCVKMKSKVTGKMVYKKVKA